MVAEKTLILDEQQVLKKIKRMAFEIYENNFHEKNIVVAGINGQGYVLAKLLVKQIQHVSPLDVTLVKVSLDKLAPQQSEVTLDCDLKTLKEEVYHSGGRCIKYRPHICLWNETISQYRSEEN